MSTQEERLAHNEATFRDANEEIRTTLDEHEFDAPLAPFICECSDPSCRALMRIPLETYRKVRSVPTRFILAAGHEDRRGAEDVVERHDGFVVVEKHGDAGDVAAERAEDACDCV